MSVQPIVSAHWPEPVPYAYRGRYPDRHRYYDGAGWGLPHLVGVSDAKGPIQLGTEFLMKWAVGIERDACLTAAAQSYSKMLESGEMQMPSIERFLADMESRLKGARADVKAKEKAGEVGSKAHDKIHWWLKRELDLTDEPEPTVPEASELGFMSFQDRWRDCGYRALRMEQQVWYTPPSRPDRWYAGQFDLLATDRSGRPGLVDFKTSKGVYPEYHIQVAAYANATRGWSPVEWCEIWRVPKVLEDERGLAVEVKKLGEMYDREVLEEKLLACFWAGLYVFRTLVERAA